MTSYGIGSSVVACLSRMACVESCMRFATYRTDLPLRGSPILALGLFCLTLVATACVLAAALPVLLRASLALLALGSGSYAAWRLMRPRLKLRWRDATIEYQANPRCPWRCMPSGPRCFVSPWFIGWRDDRGRGHGLFRTQLGHHDFRRLAVLMRHQRPG